MSFDWLGIMAKSMQESYRMSVAELFKLSKAPPLSELKSSIETAPADVVYTQDRVKLLHYKPVQARLVPTPLLIVYALINRYYILDLQPDRSVVRRYLERGLDVYMIDWGDPSPSDRYQTISDHLDYLDTMVDVVRQQAKTQRINLQGYCMGGTFAAIYAALNPRNIQSLIIQAAPIDFSTQAGILHVWSRYIDADKLVETLGNIPGEFLNITFLLVNPIRLMLDKYVGLYENIADKEFVENFLRMERWIFDSPDVPGEVYRQFIKDFYQQNRLVKDQLVVNGRHVHLKRISMPLLNLIAEYDNLVPPESSKPLNDLVASREKELRAFPSGHIGLSVSAKAHRDFWPSVAKWIVAHSAAK